MSECRTWYPESLCTPRLDESTVKLPTPDLLKNRYFSQNAGGLLVRDFLGPKLGGPGLGVSL